MAGGRFFTDLICMKTIDRKRPELGLSPSKGGWSYILGQKIIVSTDAILGLVPEDVEI
jgi:hypothetical protein